MQRSEIIDLASALTERKSENVINLQTLYAHVLQEFCEESRFWWRKRTFTFNTVAGTSAYDLITQMQAAGLTDTAIEEVTTVVYVPGDGSYPELTPVFDDIEVITMLEDTSTGGAPSVYTFDFTDYKTLRINKPNGIYKIRVIGWMVPNPASDSASDSVPLVPPQFHRGIVHGMEKYIWRTVYGLEDPKTVTAQQAYDKVAAQAQIRPRFTTNYTQQLISSEDSIQSTNNGRTNANSSGSSW